MVFEADSKALGVIRVIKKGLVKVSLGIRDLILGSANFTSDPAQLALKFIDPVESLVFGFCKLLVFAIEILDAPSVLMLDEPSAALAPKVVLEIFANINKIAKSGVTILVVEQNVRMALILAKYGYIIRDGIIMMEGEAKKLISDPAVKESFLGGSVANASKKLTA